VRIFQRIWNLIGRSKVEREIDAELQSHLEMRIEDNLAAGMSREQAERDARRRFGNPVVMKERVTEKDAALGLDSLLRDVRYAVWGFAKGPGFAAVAIITLALGIGVNTAIFQLLDAVRLRSLPVSRPQELAEIKIAGDNGGFDINDGQYAELTQPVWQEIRQHHEPFSDVFAWRTNLHLVGQLSDARRIYGLEVSGDFFRVLGIRPWRGRLLLPEDETPDCKTPRVVVSYPYWQAQMGGRDLTANSTLLIDNELAEVVGVTPPGFYGMAVGESFDIAFPLCEPNPPRAASFLTGL
jgi:MacB-like periplasmic core domain